jgi:predicted dithiol-disulfide oxidoreductase (DUF899 family)
MTVPPTIVTPAAWQAARAALLEREKALTRALDDLAAERRRLPAVAFDRAYDLDGATGPLDLVDAFEGRSQLILYHFMLEPGAASPCTGCSMFVDGLPHLSHLHARDTSLALLSRAPIAEIEAVRARMAWRVPWYSDTTGDLSTDCGIERGFGLSVFGRDGGRVYRTYATSGRGVETLGTVWTLLDLTPLGRQETWEVTPPGRPQTPPYAWWRLHDAYDWGWPNGEGGR